MFVFPPDTTGFVLSPLTVEPVTDQEGAQRTAKDGTPKWAVQTLVTPPRTDSGYQPAPFVMKVTVTAKDAPTFPPAQPAEFVDFSQYGYEFNGNAGVSYSASAIRPLRSKAGE